MNKSPEITLVETDIPIHDASPFYGEKLYIDDNDNICVLVYLCKGSYKNGRKCTNRPARNGYCYAHTRQYNANEDDENNN